MRWSSDFFEVSSPASAACHPATAPPSWGRLRPFNATDLRCPSGRTRVRLIPLPPALAYAPPQPSAACGQPSQIYSPAVGSETEVLSAAEAPEAITSGSAANSTPAASSTMKSASASTPARSPSGTVDVTAADAGATSTTAESPLPVSRGPATSAEGIAAAMGELGAPTVVGTAALATFLSDLPAFPLPPSTLPDAAAADVPRPPERALAFLRAALYLHRLRHPALPTLCCIAVDATPDPTDAAAHVSAARASSAYASTPPSVPPLTLHALFARPDSPTEPAPAPAPISPAIGAASSPVHASPAPLESALPAPSLPDLAVTAPVAAAASLLDDALGSPLMGGTSATPAPPRAPFVPRLQPWLVIARSPEAHDSANEECDAGDAAPFVVTMTLSEFVERRQTAAAANKGGEEGHPSLGLREILRTKGRSIKLMSHGAALLAICKPPSSLISHPP